LSFLSTNTSGNGSNGSKYPFAYFTQLHSRRWFQEIKFEKAINIKE
jgi:hypothetical protein